MRLALLGMSGTGKTFWTKKLAEKGTPAVFCDDRIERRLAPKLGPGGYSGINGVAAWMGWPTSPAYAEREAAYLAATAGERQLLIERYLNDPKPVLWRGAFQPKSGETARETVARCYPALIEARRRSYEALAHCTVSVGELRATSDAEKFLERVRRQMK